MVAAAGSDAIGDFGTEERAVILSIVDLLA